MGSSNNARNNKNKKNSVQRIPSNLIKKNMVYLNQDSDEYKQCEEWLMEQLNIAEYDHPEHSQTVNEGIKDNSTWVIKVNGNRRRNANRWSNVKKLRDAYMRPIPIADPAPRKNCGGVQDISAEIIELRKMMGNAEDPAFLRRSFLRIRALKRKLNKKRRTKASASPQQQEQTSSSIEDGPNVAIMELRRLEAEKRRKEVVAAILNRHTRWAL